MSDYTYTGDLGWALDVTGDTDVVWIATRADDGQQVGMSVKKEDAPAVALAILEAAGFGAGDYIPGEIRDPDHAAVHALRQWKKEQDAKAEREAEDAKVAQYRAHQYRAQYRAPDPSIESGEWRELSEDAKELWRTEYRSAAEFFKGES